MAKKKAVVIGSGFAGLSASAFLSKSGFDVTVLEKNMQPGGRARQLVEKGFKFDMGPSWYWMPDVFDRFFNQFGKQTSDYYSLARLDPSYTVVFGRNDVIQIPADYNQLREIFESLEPGSGKKLDIFIKEAEYKYEVGINDLVYKPSRSVFEFMNPALLAGIIRMDVFKSFQSHIENTSITTKFYDYSSFRYSFWGLLLKTHPRYTR
jgi:phytoene desaturase